MIRSIAVLALCVTLPFAASAYTHGQPGPSFSDTPLGRVLATPEGRTLYTFDEDPLGKSVCNATCTDAWPPHLAEKSDKPTGDFTLVTRSDGTRQWAWKGKPLYLWAGDRVPGDVRGDGVAGLWHVARP